jgi:hypothetical protein
MNNKDKVVSNDPWQDLAGEKLNQPVSLKDALKQVKGSQKDEKSVKREMLEKVNDITNSKKK